MQSRVSKGALLLIVSGILLAIAGAATPDKQTAFMVYTASLSSTCLVIALSLLTKRQ